jgi:hypothetical protein
VHDPLDADLILLFLAAIGRRRSVGDHFARHADQHVVELLDPGDFLTRSRKSASVP